MCKTLNISDLCSGVWNHYGHTTRLVTMPKVMSMPRFCEYQKIIQARFCQFHGGDWSITLRGVQTILTKMSTCKNSDKQWKSMRKITGQGPGRSCIFNSQICILPLFLVPFSTKCSIYIYVDTLQMYVFLDHIFRSLWKCKCQGQKLEVLTILLN